MEFALSEEQRMLQDTIGRFLEEKSALDRVRATAEAHLPLSQDIWSGVAELGVAGVLVPEEYGGLGLGVLEAALISEMLGRCVAPVPFVGSAVMASLAVTGGGSDAQKQKWLPDMASGKVISGVAVSETIGARDGAGIRSENGKLSGKALFVIDGPSADVFVVADQDRSLYLVEASATGLTRTDLTTIDLTRPVSELNFDNVEAELLPNGGEQVLGQIVDAGRVMLAADTLGAGDRMLEMAVAYAKERKQFGRVIGSFQAVKHLCAEMAAELEPCRSLLWYAAYAQDELPDERSLMACHAKAHLSETGRFVARTATEVHGGMGFTDLLGLHYWFKRIGLDRQLLGGPEKVREEAARLQGWGLTG
jgi:alkylation response protein AidB-like acyl-CoA dehydrogenase